MQTMTVYTKECFVCKQGGKVENVPVVAYHEWQKGAFIQNALPMLSNGDREQLLTGTHSECFDKMFPPDEDD